MVDNKTLLGKLGFDDKDFKTPEHDRMLDIIMNDSAISKIANILRLKLTDQMDVTRIMTFDGNDKWKKEEEYILKTSSNFVVGAIDIRVSMEKTFQYNTDECEHIRDGNWFVCNDFGSYKDLQEKSEQWAKMFPDMPKKCCENRKFVSMPVLFALKHHYGGLCPYIGTIHTIKDCPLFETIKYVEQRTVKINIEVKTSIPSTGELIRQINVYKTFKGGEYVVIAPSFTDSQKSRLLEANIYPISLNELTQ